MKIEERLQSAFPVPVWALKGEKRGLAINKKTAKAIIARFNNLASSSIPDMNIECQIGCRP